MDSHEIRGLCFLYPLFASVLRRAGDQYFLVTPVEKWLVQVDDAPFVAGLVDRVAINGQSAIVFTTNMDQQVIVDQDHPVRLLENPNQTSAKAYVECGGGLEALITRSAYYQMIDFAEQREFGDKQCLVLRSMHSEFEPGCF